ncbi:DUF859 family phage minor structural protein [Thomasclavelia cocleata]|uniref:DUF859 family phage minor structural protein n=1 Tax=Thomasclavelia cocleata TaxID=69824 RepID=UPI0025707D19|nr:DUF859 family phage minor structural protein [Thomasclavelia cocleata]
MAYGTSNKYIVYDIGVTEHTVDVNNNNSRVNVSVRIYRTNSGYTTYGSGNVYCRVNGNLHSQSITSAHKITNAGITFNFNDILIPHNADGTKVISVTAWFSHSQFSSGEQGTNVGLTTIPRATQPSVSYADSRHIMGTAITINMPRVSGAFTHHLYYSFNGSAEIGIGAGYTTSYTWTIPRDLANRITNNVKSKGYFRLYTFNGNTNIGSKTVEFEAVVPDDMLPEIKEINLSENESEIKDKIGLYVKTKSKIKGEILAESVFGATVKSYKIEINGTMYNDKNFTTDYLIHSGKNDCKVTVTDSRGRVKIQTLEFNVEDYEKPKISKFDIYRCDEDGNYDDEGENIKYSLKASVSQVVPLKDVSFFLQYKKKSETSYTDLNISSSTNEIEKTGIIKNIDNNNEYIFTVNAGDCFETYKFTKEIGTAFVLVDYNSSGNSIAFGKISQRSKNEKALDVGMPVYDECNTRICNNLAKETYENADNTLEAIIMTNINTFKNEMMYVITYFYKDKKVSSKRMQYAFPENKESIYIRHFNGTSWSEWSTLKTGFVYSEEEQWTGEYMDLYGVKFPVYTKTFFGDGGGKVSSGIAIPIGVEHPIEAWLDWQNTYMFIYTDSRSVGASVPNVGNGTALASAQAEIYYDLSKDEIRITTGSTVSLNRYRITIRYIR